MPSTSPTEWQRYAALRPDPALATWTPPRANPLLAAVLVPQPIPGKPLTRTDYRWMLAARVQGMVDTLTDKEARQALRLLLPPDLAQVADGPLADAGEMLLVEGDLLEANPLLDALAETEWPVRVKADPPETLRRLARVDLRAWLRLARPRDLGPM